MPSKLKTCVKEHHQNLNRWLFRSINKPHTNKILCCGPRTPTTEHTANYLILKLARDLDDTSPQNLPAAQQ
jgi:hypothetical protein